MQTMKSILFVLLFLCSTSTFAQHFEGKQIETLAEHQQALDTLFSQYELYQLDRSKINAYVKKQKSSFDLNLSLGRHNWTFQLEPKSVIGEGVMIEVMAGNKSRLLKNKIVNNYEGFQEKPENRSRFFISNNILNATIHEGDQKKRLYQLRDFLGDRVPDDWYVLIPYSSAPIESANNISSMLTDCSAGNDCSVSRVFSGDENSDERFIEMVAIADFPFYNNWKGANCTDDECVENVVTKVSNIVALSSDIYEDYFDVSIVINYIRVFEEDDPYNTDHDYTLELMKARWNQGLLECIYRDVVHLFTAKSMAVEGAEYNSGFPGEICYRPDKSFSFTRCTTSEPLWYKTVAHELGHGLNAGHIDNICPNNCDNGNTSSLMCVYGGGTEVDEITRINQCNMLYWFLNESISCFSENRPHNEEDCETCLVDVEVEYNPVEFIPGCEGKDEVEVIVRVFNNCHERTIDQIDYTFHDDEMELLDPNDLGDYEVLADLGFGDKRLKKNSVFIDAGEVLEFRVMMRVLETAPFSQVVSTGQIKYQGDQYPHNFVYRSHTNSYYFGYDAEITGINLLSDLIADQIIEAPANSCIEMPEQKLSIDGTLIVDTDYCFNNSDLILKSGAEIIVNGGSQLILYMTNLTGCDQMWKGITVEEEGSLKVASSIISDAEFAITANTNAVIDMSLNQLINNYVGFYVPKSNDGNAREVNIGDFYNNYYLGNSELLPPYLDQENYSNTTYSGILVHDLNELNLEALQTALGIPTNHFRNIQNGIRAYNTNVTLEKCIFENINSTNESCAVYLEGDGDDWLYQDVDFPDDNPYTNTDFLNCRTGIKSIGMNLNVFGNVMEDVQTGVSVELSANREINITHNLIEKCTWGINLYQCAPVIGLVQNNDIRVGAGLFSSAIIVNENPSEPSGWNIYNNILTLEESTFGVFHRSGKRSNIMNNTIAFFTPNENGYAGIYLEDSPETIVSCNFVTGFGVDEEPNYKGTAIGIFNSTGTRVNCNYVNNSNIGIQYWGYCAKNQFKGNSLGGHQLGLLLGAYYNNNPVGGIVTFNKQEHAGNVWTQLFNGNDIPVGFYGAINNADAGQTPYPGSLLVDGFENQQFSPKYFANQSNWVQDIPTVDPSFDCADRPTCPEGVGWHYFADNPNDRSEDRIYTDLQKANASETKAIFENTILRGHANFSTDELNTLHVIAQQCPLEGGNAVYEARSLLSSIEFVDYNDFLNCQKKNEIVEQELMSESQINIFPNPADEILNIEFLTKSSSKTNLHIVNALGDVMKEIEIAPETNNLSLNVSDLGTGVFQIIWYLGNERRINEKFVIVNH